MFLFLTLLKAVVQSRLENLARMAQGASRLGAR